MVWLIQFGAEQPFDLELNTENANFLRSSSMNFSVYWQHADAVRLKHCISSCLAMSSATTWTIFRFQRIMGTRQLKQQAYAQLSQALAKLK